MRITLRITSAGDCWSFGVPKIDLARCYPKNADGAEQFDEAAFRAQVRDCRTVQIGSDDRRPVCAFGALLLASVGEWLDDNDRNAGGDKAKAARRIAARERRGASASVQIDLRNTRVSHKGRDVRTVCVRIRYRDNGVVAAERFDRDCALIVADFCATYSRKFVERGDPPLFFEQQTLGLLEELHARRIREDEAERIEISNQRSLSCERQRGGFCSPAKFDCPHYKDGRCVSLAKED